jgi:arginine repressor
MNRRYQDVSPEVAVSLKFGAKVGTAVAGAVVGGHELQHAMHARMRAAREGKRVQVLITMHYSVCPECGRMYVAGGTTTVRELPEFEAPGREPEKEREGPLQIPEEETPLEEAEGAPQEDLSTIMAILQALAQDPDATPEEIARRLQAQGKEVDAATVRRVMAQHPQVQEEEAEEQEDLSIIMSILQALAQDPDATPEEIARRLRAQGKEVDAATVRRVMAQHPRAEERRQVGIDLLA